MEEGKLNRMAEELSRQSNETTEKYESGGAILTGSNG